MRQKPTIYEPQFLNMRDVYTQALKELTRPYPATRISGWPKFSHSMGGFRSREFTILCGGTGTGKTTFLANISAHLLRMRERHFVMSVETGHTDYMKRILSALNGSDLNTGDPIDPTKLADLHTKNDELLTSDLVDFALYENRVTVEQLVYDLEFMHFRGAKIAMIDNLNFFMEVTSDHNANQEMDRVVHELIMFCKRVDMHVIMVMHPKKTDGGRVQSEFDVKGSSTAVQEAHNVFLFNRARETKDGSVSANDREVTFAKMRRRGSHVGKTIVFGNRGTQYYEKGYYSAEK